MKLGQPLSRVAALAALAVLGWNVYYAVDTAAPQWLGREAEPAPPSGEHAGGEWATVQADYDINNIVGAHVFGDASEEPTPEAAEAPETKLRLSLVGLIASADSQMARALIEVNQGKVEPYRVGQKIGGTDARLKSVESRRVLLERGNAVESLAMERKKLNGKFGQPKRGGG